MDLEKLAEAVREYRCLWDVSKAAYKDRRKKENAWKEVASKVTGNFELILVTSYFCQDK